jgi:hypothetical protein
MQNRILIPNFFHGNKSAATSMNSKRLGRFAMNCALILTPFAIGTRTASAVNST